MTGKTKAWIGQLGQLVTTNMLSDISPEDWIQTANYSQPFNGIYYPSGNSELLNKSFDLSGYCMHKVVATITGSVSWPQSSSCQFSLDINAGGISSYGTSTGTGIITSDTTSINYTRTLTALLSSPNIISIYAEVDGADGRLAFNGVISFQIYSKISW